MKPDYEQDKPMYMYGGKHIAAGDTVFGFASENEGGRGLIARGIVTSAGAVAKNRGIDARRSVWGSLWLTWKQDG